MADFINKESGLEESGNSNLQKNVDDTKVAQGTSNDLISSEIKANKLSNISDDDKAGNHGDSSEIKEEEWMDILGSGQLMKKVLNKGQPDSRPQRNDICKIKLEGRLDNGTVVESFECLTIHVGDAEVVQGLDFVIPLMDVGEEASAIVSARFAYGSKGREPDIPPDATLHYNITLVSAEPEPEVATLAIAKRKEIGNRKKERGNWWYTRDENTLAIQCYRKALDYLDDIENSPGIDTNPTKLNEDEIHNLFEERIKVYNNLAAAQMKIKAFDSALQSVENVLRCQPDNVKALFRKGRILAEKGNIEESVNILRQALAVEPNSEVTKKEYERMCLLQKKRSVQEKNLYKKMLGTDDSEQHQQPAAPPPTPSSNNFQTITWGLVASSMVAMVAGAVAIRYKFF